jgi:hypothetical protein
MLDLMSAFLCRSIINDSDGAPELLPWLEVAGDDIEAAAKSFFLASCKPVDVVLVRGEREEKILVFTKKGKWRSAKWTWKRGGPLKCERPCSECDIDHHFSDAWAEDAFTHGDSENDVKPSEHEALARGIEIWLPCKHCAAWIEWDHSEDFWDAVEKALALAAQQTPKDADRDTNQLPIPGLGVN